MAEASASNLFGSNPGANLLAMINAPDMQPGSDLSYQLAKLIFIYHTLGYKLAAGPVTAAQSQRRQISVPNSPEDRVVKAFNDEWDQIRADRNIANTETLSRVYGVAACVYGAKGRAPNVAINPADFYKLEMFFNVVDPLNTSGSLVLNLDPNAPDFLKSVDIAVQGKSYHRSRSVVVMNEEPVYLAYTQSAFGYVGRSVYQRPLYALKSYLQTQIANDMISDKLGLLIAKTKQPGSIIDNLMQGFNALKRSILQGGRTNNVLSIAVDESIETLNMMNVDGAGKFARDNILKDIATGADMPASMINQETMAEGFGEGTEDAKIIARYIDRYRQKMKPIYDYFDQIVMYRAWNPDFYATIQAEFPKEYGKKSYNAAFLDWKNSFTATWPNLLTEPESELMKAEQIKYEIILGYGEVLMGVADPENKATIAQWMSDEINNNKKIFTTPLLLDIEAMANYEPPAPAMGADTETKPKGRTASKLT